MPKPTRTAPHTAQPTAPHTAPQTTTKNAFAPATKPAATRTLSEDQASRLEMKIYGLSACLAVHEVRSEDIRRVYLTSERLRDAKSLLYTCAQNKIAYHIVENEELEKVSSSTHHEGICLIALEPPHHRAPTTLRAAAAKELPVVVLENVQNPHNVGAIVRVAAHFGVGGVFCLGEAPTISASLLRTSEGGAEKVPVCRVAVGDEEQFLRELRRLQYTTVATSSHVKTSLYSVKLPARTALFFGAEGDGLSSDWLHSADLTVAIPGSGNMESLNVSCAASVFLGELWRQHS